MSTVAVLGTGIMGSGMARSLHRAGHRVRVWNRTTQRALILATEGVEVAKSPDDAVRGADAILTMLTDGAAVLETMTAAAAGLHPGQVWIQTSTIGLNDLGGVAEYARTHELDLIDAPVLGTRRPAAEGQLTILCAGGDTALARVGAVLDALGAHTLRTGDDPTTGTATRLKLVLNSWVLATATAAAEAIALAEGLGIDPHLFTRTVAAGALNSQYLQFKAQAILERAWEPDFALGTAAKDAELIQAATAAAGIRTDVIAAVVTRLRRAVEEGHGGKDLAANYLVSFT